MTEPPPKVYAQPWAEGARTELPLVGDEREILTAFVDWHRETFELKCAGVPTERLSEQAFPPSGLSLHGLVRHLAGVQRWWFRKQFAGEDIAMLCYSDDDPDQDFESLGGTSTRPLLCGGKSADAPATSSPTRLPSTRPARSSRTGSRSRCGESSCT